MSKIEQQKAAPNTMGRRAKTKDLPSNAQADIRRNYDRDRYLQKKAIGTEARQALKAQITSPKANTSTHETVPGINHTDAVRPPSPLAQATSTTQYAVATGGAEDLEVRRLNGDEGQENVEDTFSWSSDDPFQIPAPFGDNDNDGREPYCHSPWTEGIR